MIATVSWFSFWLDRKAITARTLLGISTLFVLATLASNFNQRLPPVSYTKSVDVWLGVCNTFVFAALLELIVVSYLARSEDEKKAAAEEPTSYSPTDEEIPLNQITTGTAGQDDLTPPSASDANKSTGRVASSKLNQFFSKYMDQFTTKSERIDGLSRILFPIAFYTFVLIYCIVYV
jgi:hypothetical protein